MKVLVTGKNGLCGSSIMRLSAHYPQYTFNFIGREYGDLTDELNVREMYDVEQPDYVIHTAAKVGGIGGNEAGHAQYFRDNLLMNTHMIHQAYLHDVQKMIVFSSVCVFPDDLAELQEDKMHDGPVYNSNFAYGYAKRMVDIQIRAYKKQYCITNYCSVIPGNIYGPSDMYNIENGHVLPSLIHKLYLAKRDNTEWTIWGDGLSLREFIYVDDLSRVVINLLSKQQLPERLICSGDKEYSIKEIVEKLAKIADFPVDRIVWDTTKPNGQRSRPSNLAELYNQFPDMWFYNIDKGLKNSYDWFVENYEVARK